MRYHEVHPELPVGKFVETIFHLSNYKPDHAIERLVPDGSANIVIELDGQRRWVADSETHEPIQFCEGQWLSGPHRDHFCISALPDTELLAIRFHPGGLFPLFKIDIDQFADKVVDATDLLNGAIRNLRTDILQANEPEQKVRLAEEWLQRSCDLNLAPPETITSAMDNIRQNPTQKELSVVVEASGYSRKQFIYLFRKHIGLRPKDYQRIFRFSKALAQIQNGDTVRWTDVSLDCGYSDQSHLIRDFKHFSGFTPQQLRDAGFSRDNFFPVDQPDR